MNFGQCFKCGLNLPRTYLVPVTVQRGNQRRNVLICQKCKAEIEKGTPNGKNQ